MLTFAGVGRCSMLAMDIAAFSVDLLAALRREIPASIVVQCDQVEALPEVMADRHMLEQALFNLVQNAVDAAPARIKLGAGTCRLSADELSLMHGGESRRPGEWVWLEVGDDGEGMNEAVMSHVFEPFYSTRFTGRGLGMCVVSGVMRSHGGAIAISSKITQGCSVRLYFPLDSKSGIG